MKVPLSRLLHLCLSMAVYGMTIPCHAASITGKVTGRNNEPLAYANVYVMGSTIGTTTNLDGFYKLEVPEGHSEIVFRYLGYKMRVEPVMVTRNPFRLDVRLEPENYMLSEVQIRAEGEDPAYPIIRKAMEMRRFYLEQVEAYSCNVYVKGVQRITRYPDKILGVEIRLGELVDTATGIAYLSESVSRYHFKRPGQVKEEMISSKVSGSNRAFSFNQASDMEFNFYENILMAEGLSQRGFISPIASSAMLYYRYKLEGSYMENNRWIYRIAVIPKRKSDPVFSGHIYIQDSTWRIHSTDLLLTKDAQVQFVDTLRVNQVFIPVSAADDIWLQGSVTFRFVFSVLGIDGNGDFVGVFSDYNVNPAFTGKHFKGGEVMKINEDANKRDTSYWELMRPVPLTWEESRDYMKRDSLRGIRESKPYMDSLDRKSNAFSAGQILTGYTYTNRHKKYELSFSSLLENVQFNTVEGLAIGLGTGLEKRYERRRSIEAEAEVRYGFSNKKWNVTGKVRFNYNYKKFAYVSLEGGDDLVQYNALVPVGAAVNSYYSLFLEKNYMKLYQKRFGRIGARYEWINGFRMEGSVEYNQRTAVTNTTDYTFRDKEYRSYTSNNPLSPASDIKAFPTHDAFVLDLSARIRIRQKFINRPDATIIIGSRYPTVVLKYRKGIGGWSGRGMDYDHVEAGLEDEIRMGMIGKLRYSAWYGVFPGKPHPYFIDFAHFLGNQTVISEFEPKRYNLLEYYAYSTNDEYIQAFAEHNFGGLILNKIPLLKKLKLNEIAGARYLHVPGMKDHYETSFGVEKLGLFRFDFVMALKDGFKPRTGFVLGIKANVGR